jgi:Rieske Fe-S protein
VNRKQFIITCGAGCLKLAGIAALLQSCTGLKQVAAIRTGNTVVLKDAEFLKDTDRPGKYRHALLLKPEGLAYPIVVFRYSETSYGAYLLQCPHQGAELSVHGDVISCPAHGSEFNNHGEVVQGPAEASLHQYRAMAADREVIIYLI